MTPSHALHTTLSGWLDKADVRVSFRVPFRLATDPKQLTRTHDDAVYPLPLLLLSSGSSSGGLLRLLLSKLSPGQALAVDA